MKHLAFILLLLGNLAANAGELSDDNILTPPKKPIVASKADLTDITIDPRLDRRRLGKLHLLAREGGWSGNGGDFNQVSNNIWFISDVDKTVKYCLNVAEDYPLSKSQLGEQVQNSFTDWLKFFKKYDLLDNSLMGDYKIERLNNLRFTDGINRKMVRKFEQTETCKGAELQFFFGLENEIIKEYKKFASEHPYGLAIRKSYDHKKFQNNGIVWVDRFSKDQNEIAHIILHELGHVFGMEHNTTYVMDEHIAELLTTGARFKSSFLGKIESDSWKYGLRTNKPVILTSSKGRRQRGRGGRGPHRDQSICSDSTYTANNQLPRKIRRLFALGKAKCHRVSLTLVEGPSLNGRLRGLKRKHFELKIRQEGSPQKYVFEGRLGRSKGTRPKLQGPGVFTELAFDGPMRERKVLRKLTLEKSPSIFPLSGSFSLNGTTYPAKITSERGLIIEIFVPQMGRWWTLKTSNNQFE